MQDLEGTFLADLEQNPGHGPAGRGGYLPSLVTHGTIHSWRKRRAATDIEHLIFQGVPVTGALATAAGAPCQFQSWLDSGGSKYGKKAGWERHEPTASGPAGCLRDQPLGAPPFFAVSRPAVHHADDVARGRQGFHCEAAVVERAGGPRGLARVGFRRVFF